MIRRIAIGLVIAATVFLGGSQVVGALSSEGPLILTEAQSQFISDSCRVSKIALGEVHSSDAVMRVNLGQEYANISSRLMAPLNSRIGLSGRDGVELTRITAEYNQLLQQFREAYVVYDDSVSAALAIDCRSKQAEYYGAIMTAREERQEVRELIDQLNQLAGQYRTEVDEFKQRMEQVE